MEPVYLKCGKLIPEMTAEEQLAAINIRTRELVDLQYSTYNRSLLPLMKKNRIFILDAFEKLTEKQEKLARERPADVQLSRRFSEGAV